MFDVSCLSDRICLGERTVLRLNRRKYLLHQAQDFSVSENSCTGRFKDVEFLLEREKTKDHDAIFTLTLRNCGNKSVIVGDMLFFTHQEKRKHIVRKTRNVFAFNDSLESKNHVLKAVDRKGVHSSKPLCLIYDLARKEAFFSAQMTFDRNHVLYKMRFDPQNGRLEEVRCTVPVPDHELEPGQSVTFDRILIRCGPEGIHPKEVLETWAESVRVYYHIQPPEEIPAGFLCGWLISTKAEKTDSQIRRNMASAKGALRKLGVKYVWTSIDNLPDGMPGNWLLSNLENFRDTVPVFLQEIRENGFIPGLWMAPFMITERSQDFAKTAPFLIKKRIDGENASRFRWPWGTLDERDRLPLVFSLDPDKEESFNYVKEILETYAQWGAGYFMMDFLNIGIFRKTDASGSFCEESYRRFLRRLSSCCSPETFLLSAVGSSLSLAGAFSSSRIGQDYGEARQLEENFPSYPANYVINGSLGSSGAPNRNAIQNLAMWSFSHGKFFSVNSNVMTVDKPIPLQEARIAAALFGISPSGVFFQDDFARMSPDRLALLKKVLPRCPGMPEAVDLFTRTDVEQDFVRIFVKHIHKKWGSWSVCAVFNLNEGSRKIVLSAEELGLKKGVSYCMYEFWDECYMGTFSGKTAVEIPAGNCKVFRFSEKRPHPWVLSSDLHILQGEAEMEDVVWEEDTLTLRGTLKRAAGERGNLFLSAPPQYREKYFNKGMLAAKSALDQHLVIKLPLYFEEDSIDWKVEFTPCKGPQMAKAGKNGG